MFWKRFTADKDESDDEEDSKRLSRRQLFTGLRDQFEDTPPKTEPPVQTIPVLRPPGAVAERTFLSLCTQCGDCIDACPYDAIRVAPARLKSAAGTPMIDPFAAPCWNCEDAPCIASCETGALDPRLDRTIGIARLQTYNCLAHNRSICTVCSERCPIPGAIELDQGRPRIVSDICTGCGVCHSVCPAPANAIMIMPLMERPEPPPENHDE